MMLGRVTHVPGPGKPRLERERIAGLTLVRGTLYEPERSSPKRLERQARKLHKLLGRQGVRQLILPDGFPFAAAFEGFARVDPLALYRGVADLLALEILRQEGVKVECAVIALSAARLSPFVTSAAERLFSRVRGLYIDVPGEGTRYSDWLHRQYGLPVRPPVGADVTVAFSPVGRRWGRVLELSEARTDLGGLEVTAPGLELPRECAEQLLAALWERGLLERGALRVGPIRKKA